MGETDYNALLYEKVQAEYDSFLDELKTKPVDEVIEKAVSYTHLVFRPVSLKPI